MQYENLPYPELDEEKLIEEEIYYKNDQENPFSCLGCYLLEGRKYVPYFIESFNLIVFCFEVI